MRIVPESTITLYSGVEIDTGEQLVFKSKANQAAYFESKRVAENTPCTVVKKTGAVRVQVAGATVATCNYLSFVNPHFDNRTFYARIINYDYVNYGGTSTPTIEIDYVIDYWQSYMFDVQFEDMYIEREHLSQADFAKAELNPYDPSIYEFKTAENLPISPDIEKPYYSYGTNPNTDDGVYAADTICTDHNLLNRNGLLLIFSDVGLKNLDGAGGPGSSTPSWYLYDYIRQLVYTGADRNNTLNWYKLSDSIYDYFVQAGYAIPAQLGRGQLWSNQTLGELRPATSNFINAPANYVYIDNMGDTGDATLDNYYSVFSKLLGWFTDNSCLDNLLGVYPIPTGLMMYSGTNYRVPIQVQMPTAKGQQVTNKKLDLFPYSYYRVIAPNGDVKELRIEDFRAAQLGGNVCNIGVNLDIVEKPNLIVAPTNYKTNNAAPHDTGNANMNVREGLIFSQFPTLPYSIDAFRMQMAAVANSTIANSTQMFEYDLAKMTGGASGVLMGAVADQAAQSLNDFGAEMEKWVGSNGLTDAVISVSQALNSVAGIEAAYRAADYKKAELTNQMRNDATKVLVGNTDNAIYNSYAMTKPAYGSSRYHQINGDGVTNFNTNSFVDVIIMRVSINPIILAQYDKYFSNYGYNSGRCGIPRVINYMHGSTQADELPAWTTVNNKPTTFIKTNNCKTIHSQLNVANFINAMFNTGVRMIRGDAT